MTGLAVLGLIVLGIAIDLVVAIMMGSTFHYLWLWLIIPTVPAVELVTLTWTAAVMVVFTVRFITGKAAEVPDGISIGDAVDLFGKMLCTAAARCGIFVILGWMLAAFLI